VQAPAPPAYLYVFAAVPPICFLSEQRVSGLGLARKFATAALDWLENLVRAAGGVWTDSEIWCGELVVSWTDSRISWTVRQICFCLLPLIWCCLLPLIWCCLLPIAALAATAKNFLFVGFCNTNGGGLPTPQRRFSTAPMQAPAPVFIRICGYPQPADLLFVGAARQRAWASSKICGSGIGLARKFGTGCWWRLD
jgi:hypothetical protein